MTPGDKTTNEKEMNNAYDIASKLLRGRMSTEKRNALSALKATDILIVPDVYDRVEQVLDVMGIPYTVAGNNARGIGAAKFVVVNCPGEWLGNKAKQIKRFVKNGGFLITTDWTVKPLQEIFPEKIQWNGATTGDECVALDESKTTTEDHRADGPAPVWWLEGSSYPFTVSPEVKVLLKSSELFRKYGSGTVAASWLFGEGKVVHMISHYYLQRTDLRSGLEKSAFGTVSASFGYKQKELLSTGVNTLSEDVAAGSVNSAIKSAEFLYELFFDSHFRRKRS
jgi:hypothetical protein